MPNYRKSTSGAPPLAGKSHGRRQNPIEQLKSLLSPKRARAAVSITEDHIRSILTARRARRAVFGADLFSDPAWDILLELYAAQLEGRSILLADLAIAIDIPPCLTDHWSSAFLSI
ncbi:MAG TPA: hypothetical protein VFG41_09835 [Sphingomicrobium sp.]|nr:hypothetical protein [Sphingomicrobium sp.]